MTISDVIQYCLENILHRLSFEDLINVAQTNSVLKASACSVFTRRYGNSIIVFRYPSVIYIRDQIFEGTIAL